MKFLTSLTRGDGLLLNGMDFSQAVPNERWECQNCGRTMLLSPSGRCGVCTSEAVIPVAKVKQ